MKVWTARRGKKHIKRQWIFCHPERWGKIGGGIEETVGEYLQNLKSWEVPDIENAAGFIYVNYSIESAMWYWGYTEMTYQINGEKASSINDYIEYYKNLQANEDNVFLATQYFLNGRQGFSQEEVDSISQEKENVYKEGMTQFTIGEKIKPLPNGWETRYHDWCNAKKLMNGDLE